MGCKSSLKSKKKSVIVTGHKSGIGKCIAKILNEQYNVFYLNTDVSQFYDWEVVCFNFMNANKIPPWAVINCAGISEAKCIMDIRPESIDLMMKTNAYSILYSIQTFGKEMLRKKRKDGSTDPIGHIVNIASISSLMGMSGHAHYCASKFAANAIMQVAAKELSPKGLFINNVCPGPTETPMWDKLDKEYCEMNGESGIWKPGKPWDQKYFGKQLVKRLGKPEDTAYMVEWLISDKNKYITGTNIKVCGGNLIG